MNDQTSASSQTRPQMTAAQAELYHRDVVLQHEGYEQKGNPAPWDPIAAALASAPRQLTAHYRVAPKAQGDEQTFASIQKAINQAIIDAKTKNLTERLYIEIAPGHYNELVYLPPLVISGKNVPITLYGLGQSPRDTTISVNIDQGLIASEYVKIFGDAFAGMDSSITGMFDEIAQRGDYDLGTTNACVMRVRNDGFEAINLTIENSYNEDRLTPDIPQQDEANLVRNAQGQLADGQHQAVAVLIDGADRICFEKVHLLGDQDTLYFKTNKPGITVKAYYKDCYVEGDVDFIFGNSTAYFDHCEICSLGARRPTTYVAAPSTNLRTPYGIVFWDCDFTHDGSESALAGGFYFGRQWFERVRCTPYGTAPVEGYSCQLGEISHYEEPTGTIALKALEAVGKIAILHSRIGSHINPHAPWTDWKGGTFDRDGTYIPDAWNPRFRPVQYGFEDFMRYLGPWLEGQGLDYSDVDSSLPFIGEYGNS